MSDKIVNHFVLADGSTAKYDATQLAGDVPEVVDIRTGYDGTVYESAGDAVRGQVSALKDNLDDIGLSRETVENVVISGSSHKWATYANSEFIIFPVEGADEITIKTGTTATYYTVLTSDDITVGQLPYYATGYNGTVLVGSNTQAVVTIPTGGKFIVVFLKSGGTAVAPTAVINGSYNLLESVPDNFSYISEVAEDVARAFDEIENNKSELDDVKDLTIKKEVQKSVRDITDTLLYTVGSMNPSGYINTSATGYYYTSKIPVVEGDTLHIESTTTNYRMVACFNGDTVVPSAGVESVFSFTVPSGVDGVVLTIYNNSSRNYGTVIKTSYHDNQNILSNKVAGNFEKANHTYAKRHPMVTFIDDDGNVEFYTYLLPMMRTYNIPMVSAYMGDANPDMQSNADMMNYDQCVEVVEAGGELITHYRHDAASMTLDDAENMMLKSKNVLDKFGFGKSSGLLAYSNGTSTTDIRAMVSKHFVCAFSGAYPRVSNTDRSNHDCIVQYAIHREPAGGLYYDNDASSRTLQYFKDMVDECVTTNGWLVFTLHSWLMPEGKKKPEYADTDQLALLENIIQYIQTLQGNGSDIEVVTASQGLEVFGNAYQAGDYMGHWNEQTFSNLATFGDHNQAGIAINKEGKFDFPTSNAIN